jgi:hypothetical protein
LFASNQFQARLAVAGFPDHCHLWNMFEQGAHAIADQVMVID